MSDGWHNEHERRAAADLEWATLLDELARGCAGEVAARRLRSRRPASEPGEARRLMRTTAAALEALAQADPVPQRAVADLEELLGHIERGGAVEGEELLAVGRLLTAARELRAFVARWRERQPALAAALDTSAELDAIEQAIARALDERGRVVDEASKALAAARARCRHLRDELLSKLGKFAARYADVLRDARTTVRDGRHVLAVRADAHRRVDGIVIGTSSTGATLFVEPPPVTELGNRLRVAEGEAAREEAKVLAELSARVAERSAEVRDAYRACIEADVLGALSRWAERSRALALEVDDEPRIELVGVRHPLLVLRGGEVVANDVGLASGSALVISGPNAGGKTVALKCLGLMAWMARAGLPLPVREGSQIGWYREVLTDIGDQQSLERSLSSFSGEVDSLGRMLERADRHSLVLLDEVAGATDPEEGAALAAAVLEALVARGAAVAATTHYERLKELAAAQDAFVNASVGFDFDTMQPTFELAIGSPGASSALAVASRHGMPTDVIDRARALLSAPARDREELIRELERERRALAAAREEAERTAAELARLEEEMREQRRVVRDKERQKLADEKADLVARVKRARAEIRELSGRLAEAREAAELREAERRVDRVAHLVAADGELERATRAPRAAARPLAPEQLVAGARVYVERLGAVAEIEEPPDRGQVKVRAGALSLRVPVAELRSAERGVAKRSAPRPAPPPAKAPSPEARVIRTSSNTCDLRGLRVDEALEQLERFVDRMLSSAEPAAFVLHGHGTGALRQAVREQLALSTHVALSRPARSDEGGDAFTVFWLRD